MQDDGGDVQAGRTANERPGHDSSNVCWKVSATPGRAQNTLQLLAGVNIEARIKHSAGVSP